MSLFSIVEVLSEVRALLALPDTDFTLSGWADRSRALEEIDAALSKLKAGERAPLASLQVLFAPTGDLQEVSLCSGWSDRFLELAEQFDLAIENL